jgi:hypothetical protein
VSDESVRAALRTDATLVVVEAPAGCGKTHQGADYAKDMPPLQIRGERLSLPIRIRPVPYSRSARPELAPGSRFGPSIVSLAALPPRITAALASRPIPQPGSDNGRMDTPIWPLKWRRFSNDIQ